MTAMSIIIASIIDRNDYFIYLFIYIYVYIFVCVETRGIFDNAAAWEKNCGGVEKVNSYLRYIVARAKEW